MRPEDAALSTASRFGITASEPVTLSDSNNVVLWLRPTPVVAKVATGHHRRLALELEVAKHLVTLDAPVVRPADELPQRVHHRGGFEVTFWKYQPHPKREVDQHQLAHALSRLHVAMGTFAGALPPYQNEFLAVAEVLMTPTRVPDLPERDRVLLLSALGRFSEDLALSGTATCPLHGSPHDSNTMVTNAGIRFLDLETALPGTDRVGSRPCRRRGR